MKRHLDFVMLKKDLPGIPAGTTGSFLLNNGIGDIWVFNLNGFDYEFASSKLASCPEWFEVRYTIQDYPETIMIHSKDLKLNG